MQPVSFGLVADSPRGVRRDGGFPDPRGRAAGRARQARGRVYRAGEPEVPEEVDLVLYQDGAAGPEGTYTFHRGEPGRTATEIVRENEDMRTALARSFPGLPRAGGGADTSFHRAARMRFSPSPRRCRTCFPSFVELPWALGEFASDTAFLTANQIRMAFLIAAACGRQVGFAQQKAEILGIAAGAFGWRALARELTGKIPFGGGLIPKGAIAYAVTYAIGKGLERFYQSAQPYTKAEQRQIYEQAYARGRQAAQITAPSR